MLPILLRQETINSFETFSEKIIKREKPGPLIYQKLIRAKSLTPRKSQLKRLQDCNYSDEDQCFPLI